MGTPAYDRENTRRINLKLNNNTDADIINKLESTENIQGYIKQLIRADIKEEGNKMSNTKKWWIVDNEMTARCEIYDSRSFSTREDAMKTAEYLWEHMTSSEQKKCDSFYICRAMEDEDGCLDYKTATDIEYIKE